jgi:gliding motility-associatede transport system auxiliary component
MTGRLLKRDRKEVLGITSLVIGVLLITAGLITWGVSGESGAAEYIIYGAGILLVIYGAILNRRIISEAWASGRFARGGNAVILIISVTAIMVFLNILVSSHQFRKDMTADKYYSLSQQTLDVMKTVDTPVEILYFYTKQHNSSAGIQYYEKKEKLERLLREYQFNNANIKAEFIDADVERELARSYEVSGYGLLIVKAGTRKKEINDYDLFEDNYYMAMMQGRQPSPVRFMGEQEITSALLEVLSDEIPKIYFLTGHGEKSISGNEAGGYRLLKEYLEREIYETENLNLVDEEKVPDDCSILVIAGPDKPLFEIETKALEDYLNCGGNALILVEPESKDPGLKDILRAKAGIELVNGIIIDPSSILPDGTAPTPTYRYHPIVEPFSDSQVLTVLFGARGMKKAGEAPEGADIKEIFSSSENGWSEQDFEEEVKKELIEMVEGRDILGPFALGFAMERKLKTAGPEEIAGAEEDGIIESVNQVENKEKDQRIVVIGDSDFITNEIVGGIRGLVQNIDLFMNSISWIAGKQEGLSIRPKELTSPPLIMTQTQSRLVMFLTIIITPLIVLIIGIAVWVKRRNA